jgi:isopentenyl-diphosphate delta-isomerase
VAQTTPSRKADHIRICLNQKAQAHTATTGFEDINFVHKALPEINKTDITLSTSVLGHRFSAPLIVGAMTGGTPEAEKINATIAAVVEKLRLGMGVGSQRAAIDHPELVHTFAVTRKKAPNAFLIANVGGVQLVHGYGLAELKKAVEMIDADAIAIHLNALQEAVQPEGQTNFKGVLSKIAEFTSQIDVPVVVKETGCGISAKDAQALMDAGVKAIDVGGLGGTSFAAVEYYRTENDQKSVQHRLGEMFWDWGIPTAASLVEVTQTVKIPVFASGGIRDGSDAAKALAMGVSLVGLSQPVLETAVLGEAETEALLSLFIEELKTVMFLVGAKNISQLSSTPLVIGGKTGRWLKTRGYNIKAYAQRRTP